MDVLKKGAYAKAIKAAWFMPYKVSKQPDNMRFVMSVDTGNIPRFYDILDERLLPDIDQNIVIAFANIERGDVDVEKLATAIIDSRDPDNKFNLKEYWHKLVRETYFSPENLGGIGLNIYLWLAGIDPITDAEHMVVIERLGRWGRHGSGVPLLRELIKKDILKGAQLLNAIESSIRNIHPEHIEMYIKEGIDLTSVPSVLIEQLSDAVGSGLVEGILGKSSLTREDLRSTVNSYNNKARYIQKLLTSKSL